MAGADGLPSNDPVAVAGQLNEQVPHSRDLGMEVVAVETDQIRMRLIPQPWLLADDDAEQICSSVLYSLADSAAGLAVFAAAGALAPIATLDLRMNYLRPAASGRALLAVARCHHLTDEVAFVQCEICSEGQAQPVATGSATFMRNTSGKRFKAFNEQENSA